MDEEQIRTAFEKEGIANEIKCPQAFIISEKIRYPEDGHREVLQQERSENQGVPAGLL